MSPVRPTWVPPQSSVELDPNDPEANAPVGYRFAGYAPVPNPGETSPGWEYKDGKWIFVGQTAAPAPPPMPIQMPVTEVPQPMPMFTGSAQPMMMPMQSMPMQSMPMPMYGGYPMMMAPGGGSAAPNPGPAQL